MSRPEPVLFRLEFDDNGAYVDVVNESGKQISVPHDRYGGATREILRMMDAIEERNSFVIDWDTPTDRLYLARNQPLIGLLKGSEQWVDKKLTPIRVEKDPAQLVMSLKPGKSTFRAKVFARQGKNTITSVQLLDESHLFAKSVVYPVKPLGRYFENLSHFETRLPLAYLNQYLSLLYSHMENMVVALADYQERFIAPKQLRPTLIFEEVDTNGTLHLRVTSSPEGVETDFFDQFDITCNVEVDHEEKTITVSKLGQDDSGMDHGEIIHKRIKKHLRDLDDNKELYVNGNFFLLGNTLAERFIHKDLPGLIHRYKLMGSEKLTKYNIKTVAPRLDLSLSHGIDFLAGDATLNIEGESYALFDVLNQYKKQSYISLNDGNTALINPEYMQKLDRLFKKKKKGVCVSFFDLPIVEEMIDEKTARKTLKKAREIFMGFNTLRSQRVRLPALNATLRGYQKQGFKWARYLYKNKLGGCLADDMGLGKTLQAIALLSSIYTDKGPNQPSLVIMPKSLVFNWENELKKFNPHLTHYIYHGPQRNLGDALEKEVILSTYATVRNDIETLCKEQFHYVILDESQHIKNMMSQVSRAVMLLNTDHRLALSGTPIENNLGELYALFRFLNPSMFGGATDFNRHYTIPIQKDNDKNARHELKKKIYPFILRRLKKEVLKDLPDKVEQTLFVEMSEEQQLLYEQRRLFFKDSLKNQIDEHGIKKSQFYILQALGELRQLASIPEARSENQIVSAKREVLINQVTEAIANEHKVLVFANYLHVLDCVSQDLDALDVDYQLMTGASRNRQEMVERFQNDASCKVFLMTLKTGGLGLNLTSADYIFIFDPWWNRAAENQAIDRTHRIGQKNTVFAYRLITRGTIEEKILQLQEMKKALFDDVIASDGASMKMLDKKDLEFVLGG